MRIVCRAGTKDQEILTDVCTNNSYGLPDIIPPRATVIDIGSHIGCFVKACLDRGAEKIICFEPDYNNYILLRSSTATYDEVGTYPCAVSIGDCGRFAGACSKDDPADTVVVNAGGDVVRVTVREILDEFAAEGEVFLKIGFGLSDSDRDALYELTKDRDIHILLRDKPPAPAVEDIVSEPVSIAQPTVEEIAIPNEKSAPLLSFAWTSPYGGFHSAPLLSFAWTSPYGGFHAEDFYRKAGAEDKFKLKAKTLTHFKGLLDKHGLPELMMMGNFIAERVGIKSLCRRLDIDMIHGEDGFIPHYATLHVDPLGFCWESSLSRMVFTGISDSQRTTAMAFVEQMTTPRVIGNNEYTSPYVLWPLQLIQDNVNKHDLNISCWDVLIGDFLNRIPEDFCIVIKPHPRDRSKAATLAEIFANTKRVLFTSNKDLTTLIYHSNAVAGANSTVLTEARLLYNKPVYAYAKSWYTGHDELVYPVRRELPAANAIPNINELEAGVITPCTYIQEYALWYLYQLLARQFNLDRLRTNTKQVYEEFSQFLYKRTYKSYVQYGEEIWN